MSNNKYLYVHVIQGNYGYGWEDLTQSESTKEAYSDLKVYRDIYPAPVRIIKRRELNPEYKPVKCFDNGGDTIDRYTVVYLNNYCENSDTYFARGMSSNPTAPNGCGMSTEVGKQWLRATTDKLIPFDQLPDTCKQLIESDLMELSK